MRQFGPIAFAMLRRWRLAAVLYACVPALAHASAALPEPSCAAAADAPERDLAIPDHLLRSIGTVESAGRPWSVNVDGDGRSFATKQEAIDFVRAASAGGARLIDVGCYQIDLFYHPDAFADLDQAFDPTANAAYAGRFLASLHTFGTDWRDAVAGYHSRDPSLGGGYRDLVYAALNGNVVRAAWNVAASMGDRVRYGMRIFVPGEAIRPGRNLPRVYTP